MTDQKPRKARPNRITPTRVQKLLESIAGGQYLDASARLAGVDPSTVYSWVRHGKAEMEGADTEDPELVVAEWLDQFSDDFKGDNPMWIMDPPDGFKPDRWIYALFLHRYEKARAVAEASALANIRAAARAGNWQADAWYLERTRPEKYGRRIVAEHKGTEDGPAIKMQTVDSEQLMTRLTALAEAAKGEK